MGPIDASALAAYLTARFGLPLSGRRYTNSDGGGIELRPSEVYPSAGFLIRVQLGWRSLSVEMIPGSFAGDLIREMGEADRGSREGLAAIARLVREERGSVRMIVNNQQTNPEQPESWPVDWKQLSIAVQSPPLVPDDSATGAVKTTRHWVGRLLGMVLALAAAREDPSDVLVPETKGLPEGALVRVEVNRYERNPRNRAICIEVHGSSCVICGFDFGQAYGEIGEGFIHVHHITPVSRLSGGYIVDPVRDLIPVCANCHAMLHRSDPPFTPDYLRTRLADEKTEFPSVPSSLKPTLTD